MIPNKNLKLSTKLIGGFSMVAIAGLGAGLLNYMGLNQAVEDTHEMSRQNKALARAVDLAHSTQISFGKQTQAWKNLLLRGDDPGAFGKYQQSFVQAETQTRSQLYSLAALIQSNDVVKARVDEAVRLHTELGVRYHAALQSYQHTNRQSAATVDRLLDGLDRAPTQAIDAIAAEARRHADESMQQKGVRFQRLTGVLKTISLGAMVLGVIFFGAMGMGLNHMISKPIKQVVETLSTNAVQTVEAAAQVACASQSLAQGATEQAAALEKTSSSLEEMSGRIKRNAQDAEQAKDLAQQARAAADSGAADMRAMNTAMNEIKASSGEIAQIVKMIDEIAFQTNILALNAAVEVASKEQSQDIEHINTALSQMDQVTQATAAKAEESASAAEELNAQGEALEDVVEELLKLIDGSTLARANSRSSKTDKTALQPWRESSPVANMFS